ncbi:MAG: amino acid permease [Verrucomicrobiota bacterium]
MSNQTGVSLTTAAALVMGNMVGTGVFTSLGFQLNSLSSPSAILILWALGGLLAFCGAACYAELASALPRSGGEYHFLSRIYGSEMGIITGWASLIAGFAAPIALAALAFGNYLTGLFGFEARFLALTLLGILTSTQLWTIRSAGRTQSLLTYTKIAIIVAFFIAALFHRNPAQAHLTLGPEEAENIFSSSFALSLVYVMYAYAGWNAATYILSEIRDPERNVPRALFLGTGVVTFLYVILNGIFLFTTPTDQMKGEIEIGLIVGRELFGADGGNIMAGLISFGLLSSISAMLWVGSRIGQRMGEDHPSLGFLALTNRNGVPVVAVLFQSLLAAFLILTASFEAILIYVESVLLLTSGLAVFGLFILRHRHPDRPWKHKTFAYPFTPALFLLLTGWMIVAVAWKRPLECLLGWLTFFSGCLLVKFATFRSRKTR